MEQQDFGALLGLGVGGYFAWNNLDKSGVLSLIRDSASARNLTIGNNRQAVDVFNAFKTERLLRESVLNNNYGNTLENIFSQISGNEYAVRMGILETFSRPSFQSRFNDSRVFQEVSSTIKNASDSELRSMLDTYVKLWQPKIPEFEQTLLSNISNRLNMRYKGESYQSMLRGATATLTAADLPGIDFTRPLKTYSSEQALVSAMGDRGFVDKFKTLLGRVQKNGKVKTNQSLDELFSQGKIFSVNDSFYARMKLGSQEINVPLKRNTFELFSGDSTLVYHSDVRGNTKYSFIDKFLELDAKGKLITGPDGKTLIRSFEDAIFYGDNPVFLAAYEKAEEQGKHIMSILGGVGDIDDGNPFRYGEYFTDDISGQTVALKKASSAAVLNIREALAKNTPEAIYGAIEQDLVNEGYTVLAANAPGATGKLGSFNILKGRGEINTLNMYTDIENTSGIRRPEQPLSRPWSITNVKELEKKRYGKLSRGEWLYNPVEHPLLQGPMYRDMFLGPMSKFTNLEAHPGRFSVYSAPTLFTIDKADRMVPELGISEGTYATRYVGARPKLAANSIIHNIARPSDSVSEVQVAEGLKDLLRDIDKTTSVEERRALIKKRTFDPGYYLGQKMDPRRGLTDEILTEAGKGDYILEDIIPNEKGWKLSFRRYTEAGSGSKVFGMIKGLGLERDGAAIEAVAKRAGLSEMLQMKLENVASGSELIKPGQFSHLRSQQATGLKGLLASRIGFPRIEGNRDLSILSSSAVRGGDPVLDQLQSLGMRHSNILSGVTGSTVRHQEQLLGMLDIASRNASVFNSGDLGLIFGLERSGDVRNSLMSLLSSNRAGMESSFGSDFISKLESEIMGAKFVYGEAALMFRDSPNVFPDSRPRLERRGIEALVNADPRYMATIGDMTEKEVLLSDLAHGLEARDTGFQSAIEQLKTAQKDMKGGKKINSYRLNEKFISPKAGGGFLDLSDILDDAIIKDYGSTVFIPNETILNQLSPSLALNAEIDYHSVGYGRSVQSFLDAGNDYLAIGTDENAKRLQTAFINLKGQERNLLHENAMDTYGSRIMHSSYDMIQPNVDFMGAGSQFDEVSKNFVSRGEGVAFGMSRERIEDMYQRAIGHVGSDTPDAMELRRQLDAIIKSGGTDNPTFGAMATTRSPVITEKGRQLQAFYYDPILDKSNSGLAAGQRIVGGEDFSPLLASAFSHDFDGDRVAYNIIIGNHLKTSFDFVNDIENLKAIASGTDKYISEYRAVTNALKDRMDVLFPAAQRQESDFVTYIKSLMGQSRIGPLSVQIDRLKYSARAGSLDMGGQTVSSENLRFIERLLYPLEQEGGVGFKHGVSIADKIKSDIAGLFDLESAESMRTQSEEIFRKWFGDDIFDRGISYTTPGGEAIAIKPTATFFDELGEAVVIGSQPQAKAAFDLARLKMERIKSIKLPEYNEMLAAAEGDAQKLWALHRSIMDDIAHTAIDGKSATGSLLEGINKSIMARAAEKKSVAFGKITKPLVMGAIAAGGIYALFDKGYSSSELQVPNMQPTPLALQGKIADGSLLRDHGAERAHSQNRTMPEGVNSIPNMTYVDSNTGRINMRAVVPAGVNPNEFADSLRVTMPHAQVGVNINHNYGVPRNVMDEL